MLSPSTTRRWLALGALVAAGFAIYGSLVPFHARALSFSQALAEFQALNYVPFAIASKTDFLSNIALFVPIGFLGTGALSAGRSRVAGLIVLPLVIAGAAALSVSIEFAQLYVPDRTSSLNDVASETLGSAAGALGWLAVGPIVARWLAAFGSSTGTPRDLARRVLTTYGAVWLVLALLPFDVTIRPAELAEKYRAGRVHVRPFHDGLQSGPVLVGAALLSAPIGALAALGWPRARRGVDFTAGAMSGTAAIAAIEFCQLFIFSRTASLDDVLGGAIGATVGAAFAKHLSGRTEPAPRSIQLWPLALLACWLIVVLARHWSPFDFVLNGDMFRQRLPALFQVPFSNYYWPNPFAALSEAMTKIFLGLPVGALLALMAPPARRTSLRLLQFGAIALAGMIIFGGVEVGQIFLPSRYPDGTDVLLGVLGTCLGSLGTSLVRAAADRGPT